MNLVLIYGPPAVGKLTIANELAQLTDYKLVHNHLIGDLGRAVFKFMSPEYSRLVRTVRAEVLGQAAANEVDLILTFVFRGDKEPIDQISEVITSAGGRIHYAQLIAPATVLEKRVVTESRLLFGKMQDVEQLRRALVRWDHFAKINESDLTIDTSNQGPDVASRQIAHKFQLPLIGPGL